MSAPFKMFAGAVAAGLLSTALMGAVTPSASSAPAFVCDNTAADPLTGDHPRLHVVVEEGASCYIEDAVIHSVRAVRPENVSIVGTSLQHGVEHNIMIRGATGIVLIGNYGCGYDPKVGNNIKVRNSNNVLICQMSVDNDISVTGSHGRITIRDSVACDNITASFNDPYDGPPTTPGGHRWPDAIRMFQLRAANHITAENNSDRPVVMRDNEENFLLPSACRRTLK